MRRILINQARDKNRLKRGGEYQRVELDEVEIPHGQTPDSLLQIDAALSQLAAHDREAAELVKLRFFAGFSIDEIAQMTGTSRSAAYRQWEYAKAWLRCQLDESGSS